MGARILGRDGGLDPAEMGQDTYKYNKYGYIASPNTIGGSGVLAEVRLLLIMFRLFLSPDIPVSKVHLLFLLYLYVVTKPITVGGWR